MEPKQAHKFACKLKKMGVKSFTLGDFHVEFEDRPKRPAIKQENPEVPFVPLSDDELKLEQDRVLFWSANG